MKFFLVALIAVIVIGQLAAARSNSLEWARYKRQHGKTYATAEEEARRFAHFLSTKTQIERHNANASHSYKMALNHLADWTPEERAMLNGFKQPEGMLERRELSAEHEAFLESILEDGKPLPKEVDWRKVPGRVSPVKNQGVCGSCWAFSTTGMLEGQQVSHKLYPKIKTLSEQNLVDCSEQNEGCNGGIMESALEDISKMGGIESESDYPYLGDEDTCSFNKTKSVMTDIGAIVLKGGELKLRKAVAKYGPVSVAFWASSEFQAYSSGVFVDKDCPRGKLNHAVLIVGYGTDAKEGDYWIVKNSWDTVWGDEGYFKMKRGVNMCGIETIPTLAKI